MDRNYTQAVISVWGTTWLLENEGDRINPFPPKLKKFILPNFQR